jgi:hypothetical protein
MSSHKHSPKAAAAGRQWFAVALRARACVLCVFEPCALCVTYAFVALLVLERFLLPSGGVFRHGCWWTSVGGYVLFLKC